MNSKDMKQRKVNIRMLASLIAEYYDEESFDEDFEKEDFEKHILSVLENKDEEFESLIDFFVEQSRNNDMVAMTILADLRVIESVNG